MPSISIIKIKDKKGKTLSKAAQDRLAKRILGFLSRDSQVSTAEIKSK